MRLMAMLGLLLVAAFCNAIPTIGTDGIWVNKGNGPAVGMYTQSETAVLDFHSADSLQGKPGYTSTFAIAVDKNSAWFQVTDANGKPHVIPVTALLRLQQLPEVVPAKVDLTQQIKAERLRMKDRMKELSAKGDGLYNFRADEWLFIHEGKVKVNGKEYGCSCGATCTCKDCQCD